MYVLLLNVNSGWLLRGPCDPCGKIAAVRVTDRDRMDHAVGRMDGKVHAEDAGVAEDVAAVAGVPPGTTMMVRCSEVGSTVGVLHAPAHPPVPRDEANAPPISSHRTALIRSATAGYSSADSVTPV